VPAAGVKAVVLTTDERQLLVAVLQRSRDNADYALMNIHPADPHRGPLTVDRHMIEEPMLPDSVLARRRRCEQIELDDTYSGFGGSVLVTYSGSTRMSFIYPPKRASISGLTSSTNCPCSSNT